MQNYSWQNYFFNNFARNSFAYWFRLVRVVLRAVRFQTKSMDFFNGKKWPTAGKVIAVGGLHSLEIVFGCNASARLISNIKKDSPLEQIQLLVIVTGTV